MIIIKIKLMDGLKKMKNKKAEISIVILVIGIFAICGIAFLSFFSSNFRVGHSFESIGLIEEINSQSEIYAFYIGEGNASEKVNQFVEVFEDEQTFEKYLYAEKKSKAILFLKKPEVLFSVRYGLGE